MLAEDGGSQEEPGSLTSDSDHGLQGLSSEWLTQGLRARSPGWNLPWTLWAMPRLYTWESYPETSGRCPQALRGRGGVVFTHKVTLDIRRVSLWAIHPVPSGTCQPREAGPPQENTSGAAGPRFGAPASPALPSYREAQARHLPPGWSQRKSWDTPGPSRASPPSELREGTSLAQSHRALGHTVPSPVPET